MRLVFYVNYLNHHQVLVADELYRFLGEEYRFVATLPRNEKELKGGVDYSTRPYCILAGESEASHQQALKLACEADTCVFGACSQEYAVERAKQKNCGLAFEMGERWLKRGIINILSPNLRKWWFNYMRYYRKKPYYKLCSGAYVAPDDEMLGCYKGRHYKWGYFTEVDENLNVEMSAQDAFTSEITPLMWCARFLMWKHPEQPVLMAKNLKDKGYKFILNFYGSGDLEEPTKQLAKRLGVEDRVIFHGNKPNAEILDAMRAHDIFLFTSDRYEGWGAVANEAMANGCVLVGNSVIGSVPYLVDDKVTGCIYNESLDNLIETVTWLLDNPEERSKISLNGYHRMCNIWSPINAAKSLLKLVDYLNKKGEPIMIGPGSKS